MTQKEQKEETVMDERLMTVTPLDKEIDDVAQQLELMSKEGHIEKAEGMDFTRSINY